MPIKGRVFLYLVFVIASQAPAFADTLIFRGSTITHLPYQGPLYTPQGIMILPHALEERLAHLPLVRGDTIAYQLGTGQYQLYMSMAPSEVLAQPEFAYYPGPTDLAVADGLSGIFRFVPSNAVIDAEGAYTLVTTDSGLTGETLDHALADPDADDVPNYLDPDNDNDGVVDDLDQCPDAVTAAEVDETGCPADFLFGDGFEPLL